MKNCITSSDDIRIAIGLIRITKELDINTLDSKGNYSATSNNSKLVRWPFMGGLIHLVQREGAWAGCGPSQSLLAVPNVTAYPSTTNVPITVLLYDGQFKLPCGFNVAIKELINVRQMQHGTEKSLIILTD